MLPWWPDVTNVIYDVTIVVLWQVSTGSITWLPFLLLPPSGYCIWGTENWSLSILKIILLYTWMCQYFDMTVHQICIFSIGASIVQVQEGVDDLLFNLLILGSITNKEGYVWRRSTSDLYVVETMPLLQRDTSNQVTKCCHISLMTWVKYLLFFLFFFAQRGEENASGLHVTL